MAGKKKILIVDDEQVFAHNLAEYLNQAGGDYEVNCVYNGEAALKALGEVQYSLIITDIKMPGISGLELLSRVRGKYPQIGVIVMTAYGLPEIKEDALNRGSLSYIEKPFEMKKLEGVIAASFEKIKGFKPEKGFGGEIANFQLTDLIQLNCLSQATNALTISNGDRRGIIYFRNGEIVHSVCGGLEGEEALFTILGWVSGYITTHSTGSDKKTIDKDWSYLLLEGARRSDEVNRDAVEQPIGTSQGNLDGFFQYITTSRGEEPADSEEKKNKKFFEYLDLGFAYLKKKEYEKARSEFKNALEIREDNEIVKHNLRVLNKIVGSHQKEPSHIKGEH